MKQVTISTPFITLIVLDYGAIIQKLLIKDKYGNTINAVIGHDFPSDYTDDQIFLGACIGRYAGRISGGAFELDRETFLLHQDNGVHLHGGKEGFGKKYWTFEEVDHGNSPFVRLSYNSKHLEEGYPGNLKVSVTYRLENNQLHIIHKAITDRTTVVNLTNHSYFRLDDAPTVDNYELQLNCSHYLETDKKLLPTGKLASVKKTNYDFRNERPLKQTRLDTPFVIDTKMYIAATIRSRLSGIGMKVITNQPAMVVYTPPEIPAICFETQNYPDAPNFPEFPSSILKPEEVYENRSQFIFDLD